MGLKESIAKTVHMTICKMIEDMERNIPIEELAYSVSLVILFLFLIVFNGLMFYCSAQSKDQKGKLMQFF